jgi:Carbohydrate family 9 binding domain-like
MKPLVLFLTLIVSCSLGLAQNKMTNKRLTVAHITADFPITELDNKNWDAARKVSIDKYWSGKTAPAGRHAKARLLWSDTAIYIRFEADQTEPLIVSDTPNPSGKTMNLWDRDVCEIFIAPGKNNRRKYYEFEIAPNGEWVDVALEIVNGKRHSDFDYKSGMESAAKIGDKKVVMAIKVEWKALGKTPKAGDVWLGNLFRCVGKDPTRGYLAWQPTMTKNPNFHVPEKFGELEFVK